MHRVVGALCACMGKRVWHPKKKDEEKEEKMERSCARLCLGRDSRIRQTRQNRQAPTSNGKRQRTKESSSVSPPTCKRARQRQRVRWLPFYQCELRKKTPTKRGRVFFFFLKRGTSSIAEQFTIGKRLRMVIHNIVNSTGLPRRDRNERTSSQYLRCSLVRADLHSAIAKVSSSRGRVRFLRKQRVNSVCPRRARHW